MSVMFSLSYVLKQLKLLNYVFIINQNTRAKHLLCYENITKLNALEIVKSELINKTLANNIQSKQQLKKK